MCARACMRACMRACVRACVRACMCACMRVYVHVCVLVCMYVCVHESGIAMKCGGHMSHPLIHDDVKHSGAIVCIILPI